MTSSFYIQSLLVGGFIISRLIDSFLKETHNKFKKIYIVVLNILSIVYITVYAQAFLTLSLENVHWFHYLIYSIVLILYVVYIIKIFKNHK